MINPKKFAFYLKNSSLNSDEQQVVLSRLPDMSEDEQSQLYDQLEKDHMSLKKVLQKVHIDRETVQFNFYKDLRQA